jgi:hypothetical protein
MMPDEGYARHLFAGGQLPLLQQLIFLGDEDAEDDLLDLEGGQIEPFLDDICIARMAACCPELQRLLMPHCLIAGVQLTPLLQLTALTELVLAGDQIDDQFVQEQLLMLTRPQALRISDSEYLTDTGLGQLTALTGLSRLAVWHCELSYEMSEDLAGCLLLSNKQVHAWPGSALAHVARAEYVWLKCCVNSSAGEAGSCT